ncbi:MAG: metalloregulator ArsR/SmtB family transcription factor [Anaerolineales bacterium]
MTTNKDTLSLTFAALADPTRRKILAILADGERTVTQLGEPFEITQPAISKHLRVLERAGLIVRGREAQWRPAKLEAAPLKEASDWVQRYRQNWEDSFDRLGAYLQSIQAEQQENEGKENEGKEDEDPKTD